MPPAHPHNAWLSTDDRYAWMETISLLGIVPVIGFLALATVFWLNAMFRSKRHTVDEQRSLHDADALTDRAVEQVFKLLPSTWQARDVVPSNENRDEVVQCTVTQSERSFAVKAVEAAPLLKRAVPAAWILDTNPKTGIMHQEKLSSLWGTSTPQANVRTFMSHAWKADPTETARALNFSLKLKFLLLYLGLVAGVAGYLLVALQPLLALPLFAVLIGVTPQMLFTGAQWANRPLLWFMGYSGAQIWMDKATVKQRVAGPSGKFLAEEQETAVLNLNALGVALFPWFLLTAEEIWICHSEHYFRRIWCIYELSTWLAVRGTRGVRFVSLEYAALQRELLVFFLRWAALLNCLASLLVLSFGPTYRKSIVDECGQAPGVPLDQECWNRKANIMIQLLFWCAWLPASVGFGVFFFVPIRAVRRRITAELGSFSVRGCDATVPTDIQVVHQFIHEQHGGLEAFDQLVRSKVRASVDWLMWREELIIGVWLFGFWFIVYWFWFFCIHASLGTFHPALAPNLFIEWGDDNQATAIAVHVLVVIAGVVVWCCVTPLLFAHKIKKLTGERQQIQPGAVAPVPNVPQPQPQAVPQPTVAAQPAYAPQPQVPVAVPIAQPMATAALVDVACPAGAGPGFTMMVQHQGKAFNVTVPAGVQPGQHFQVQVPA